MLDSGMLHTWVEGDSESSGAAEISGEEATLADIREVSFDRRRYLPVLLLFCIVLAARACVCLSDVAISCLDTIHCLLSCVVRRRFVFCSVAVVLVVAVWRPKRKTLLCLSFHVDFSRFLSLDRFIAISCPQLEKAHAVVFTR